jgi:anti-sigma-K factor RskA
MKEPPDLRELVGDDLPPEELARLESVDSLLRSVPGPPAELPPSLTRAVSRLASVTPLWTRRRLGAALALAAALSAIFFGIGFWAGGESFETRRAVPLQASANAPGASALIKLGPRDARSGNWEFLVEVAGLEQLPEPGYYTLWLAKDGEYAATCGTFSVREDGTASVRLSASYRLDNFDHWVITAWLPHRDNAHAPWLLSAPTA